ncbi:MAG: DUF6165 family protein [Candidatus Krumholzibacteria bacterium]|jgi:hypothetical protein|nr:DUF6165 family protein [Candidatus Krumholzibacteria bacterium]
MKIEVSTGELVDKVAILAIKLEKFEDEAKKANVRKEYELLAAAMKSAGISTDSPEFLSLKEVNLKLWHIEDDIRSKERKKEFDGDFIELARSVYITNDVRAGLKREINMRRKSGLMEEKEYADYGDTDAK